MCGGHLFEGEVRAVARSPRLLPPRICKRARVEGVEPGVLDERHTHLALPVTIGCNGQSDAARTPGRLALLCERVGADGIPCLDDGTTQLFGHPQALDLTGFDGIDPAIT